MGKLHDVPKIDVKAVTKGSAGGLCKVAFEVSTALQDGAQLRTWWTGRSQGLCLLGVCGHLVGPTVLWSTCGSGEMPLSVPVSFIPVTQLIVRLFH